MNTKNFRLYTLLIAAFTITGAFFLFSPFKSNYRSGVYEIGQISEKTIIAPFTFSVYKSKNELEEEREKIRESLNIIYKIDDDVNYNIINNLNYLFNQILELNTAGVNAADMKSRLQKIGFRLSEDAVRYLKDDETRRKMYNFLLEETRKILEIGIYSDSYPEEEIYLNRDGNVKQYKLRQLYSLQEAIEKVVDKGVRSFRHIDQILTLILIHNISEDVEANQLAEEEALRNISTVSGRVLKDEQIISKNQRIDEEQYRKLIALREAQASKKQVTNKPQRIFTLLGIFCYVFLLLSIFSELFKKYFNSLYIDRTRWLLVQIILTFSLVATIIFHIFFDSAVITIPFIFSPILVSIIISPLLGLTFSFIHLLTAIPFIGWNCSSVYPMFVAVMVTILLKNSSRSRYSFANEFLKVIFLFIALQILMALINFSGMKATLDYILYGVVSILISLFAIYVLVPHLEKKLLIASRQALLDLLDLNNPLMRQMAEYAPGTYSHSLIVGNLAESAADAIKADSLLARIGSYYHDIGKIDEAGIFIENNSQASQIHDKLDPEESAVRIREHVTRGIAKAKRDMLPQAVIDIVAQHHGTADIKYFLDKAEKSDKPFNADKFRYFGPKPRSKEAALVMIADIVESTAKSMKDHTESLLSDMIDQTIIRLIREKQLSEAPITLRDLEVAKSYMLPILKGVYNKRIEYPGQEI